MGNEEGNGIAIARVDYFEKAQNDIIKGTEKELQKRPFLKTLLETMGKKTLESMLLPIFSRVTDNGIEKLLMSNQLEAPVNMQMRTLSKLGSLVTSGLKDYLSKYAYPAIRITTTFYENKGNTRVVFAGKIPTTGEPFQPEEEVFRVEYWKKKDQDNGALSFFMSKRLAMASTYGYESYMYIWKNFIADNERLAALQGSGQGPEDLGLKVYTSGFSMDKVGGYETVKEKIRRDIFFPFKHSKLLDEIGRITGESDYDEPVKAVLLYGPPGTGKTLVAKAIAQEEGLTFIEFSLSNTFTMWYGESQRRLQKALDYVEKYSKKHKVVLFIDEIDYLGVRNSGNGGAEKEDTRVLENLLKWLDGMNNKKGKSNILMVGSSNFINGIDQGLLSRFNTKIYFDKPGKDDRAKIMRLYARHLSDAEIDLLASKTDGLVGRDIRDIADTAKKEYGMNLVSSGSKKVEKGPDISYYMRAVDEFAKKKSTNGGAPFYN